MKIRAAKVPNRELFWWLNILLFGILGVVLILALNSSVSVHALCARLLSGKGISALKKRILTPEVVELLLLYGKCFIWSYELVFCLSFLLRGSLSWRCMPTTISASSATGIGKGSVFSGMTMPNTSVSASTKPWRIRIVTTPISCVTVTGINSFSTTN